MPEELSNTESSFGFGPMDGDHVRVWKDRAEALVGNFSGATIPYFWRSDLQRLRDGLEAMHRTLKGTAEFKDMEGTVSLALTVNHLGQIRLDGELGDYDGGEQPARMRFTLQIDQSYLTGVIAELDDWISKETRR